MVRQEIDERGELRYMYDDPQEEYGETVEYEDKKKEKKMTVHPSISSGGLREPLNDDDKEIASKAEEFLRRWGV